MKHKWYVLHFGLKVGGIPLTQLLIHDWSKFTPSEFIPYRKKFFGGMIETAEWKAAFRRHYSRNPHHWEYWVRNGVPIPMPEVYVREMVADWQAASKNYGDSLHDWFSRAYGKMSLHPKTVEILRPLIDPIGLKI